MKIENFHMPKSSFLSLEKDLGIIVDNGSEGFGDK